MTGRRSGRPFSLEAAWTCARRRWAWRSPSCGRRRSRRRGSSSPTRRRSLRWRFGSWISGALGVALALAAGQSWRLSRAAVARDDPLRDLPERALSRPELRRDADRRGVARRHRRLEPAALGGARGLGALRRAAAPAWRGGPRGGAGGRRADHGRAAIGAGMDLFGLALCGVGRAGADASPRWRSAARPRAATS